jgi:MFS family permease
MDFLVVIACVPTIIWCNFVVIMVFRFFYGLATGVLINCANLMLMEMVPKEKHSNFSLTVGVGFNAGFMICLLIGL